MFCPKCGKNNNDSSQFCEACGSELIDNQPTSQSISMNDIQQKVMPNAGISGYNGQLSKTKRLPKSVKILLILNLIFLFVVIVISVIASSLTSPKHIAKGYFNTIVDGDWNKMYSYFSLENSDFINQDSFIKMMENEINLEIENFEILKESSLSYENSFLEKYPFSKNYYKSSSDSDMIKTYVVNYILKGSASPQSETITLVKSSGKKFLFYPDYYVNVDNLIVSNFHVSVPKESTVYIDNIKLTEKMTSPDDDYNYSDYNYDTYVVSKIFSGEHELKVEHPICDVYTEKIQINDSDYYSSSYTVPELILNDSVRANLTNMTEDIYIQIVSSALEKKSFDTLNLACTSDPNQLAGIKESYDSLIKRLRDEDGTGYQSITFNAFTDNSSQIEFDASGIYFCDLEIEYDYVKISKDWYTDEYSELQSTYPSYSPIQFTYVYENNEWVIQRLHSLGF